MAKENLASIVLDNVIPLIEALQKSNLHSTTRSPYVLGVTGLQGCGKSTVARDLVATLTKVHQYRALEISIDDVYKTYAERQMICQELRHNKLLSARGQPGTHDRKLAREFFEQPDANSSSAGQLISVSSFDKSLLEGKGDRLPSSEWRTVENNLPIDVLVLKDGVLDSSRFRKHNFRRDGSTQRIAR